MKHQTFFDSVAHKWDNITYHDPNKIDFIVRKAVKTGIRTVLDLGCGTGVLLPIIQHYLTGHGEITALDISQKMIDIAKDKNGTRNIKYVCKDYYDFIGGQPFDLIIAYSCFPHFTDNELFFIKSYNLLKNYGTLVIAHSESRDIINLRHDEMKKKVKSTILKPANEITEQAEKYGFKGEEFIDNQEYYLVTMKKVER